MRKTVLTIVGAVLVVAGLAMLVLPGPGLVVIAIGLVVLASAGILWAARLLVRARQRLPDPPEGGHGSGLVDGAVTHIDDAMEALEAVEQVQEQERLAREQRHREQLVTTDRDRLEGDIASQDLQARVLRDTGEPPSR